MSGIRESTTVRPEHLQRRSLHVLMVTGAYPTEKRPHWAPFIKSQVESLLAAGVRVEVLHPRGGPMPLRYTSAVLQIFCKTLTGRYDIVHGQYGLWCLAARMQWTTPVVAAYLGSDLLGAPSTSEVYNWKSTAVVRIAQWLSRHVDAVLVQSEQMLRLVPWGNVFVIPNGIDFELFRPVPRAEARAALGWQPGKYYILFGNDPQRAVKNFPLAQAAIQRLHARGLTAELVVASGLNHTAVAQHINASNALLLTSFHEGSPNVVKEAMACNIPVVSTNVGDVSQLIGATAGCSVCPPDPDALAEALETALRYPGPTSGRSDIAMQDRNVVVEHVITVYENVLRPKKSR